jgi:hypothetical protein
MKMKETTRVLLLFLFLIFLILISLNVNAQSKKADSLEISGIFIQSDIGILAGSNNMELKNPISYNLSIHYRFANGVSAGIVSGVEFYNATFIPIMGEVRYSHIRNNEGPFVFFQCGQTILLEKKVRVDWMDYNFTGGYVVNPGIGYQFKPWGKASLVLSVGYRVQKYSREVDNGMGYYPKIIERYNRLNLRIGFLF